MNIFKKLTVIKTLLILITLSFNSAVFAVEYYCSMNFYKPNDNSIDVLTKLFSDNQPYNDKRMRDYSKQFAEYFNAKYNANESLFDTWCTDNVYNGGPKNYDIQHFRWNEEDGSRTIYKDVYSRKLRFYDETLDWKPKQLIAKTQQPKTTTNKKSSGRKYYPAVNECVTTPTTPSGSISRFLGNKCNFGIAVWFCDKETKYGCDSGSEHFNVLLNIEANRPQIETDYPYKYDIDYFACGAKDVNMYSMHIGNNKKGETKFTCRSSGE